MITKSEVLLIHDQVVQLHGGANGVRDMNGLESAIARPFQTFAESELYHSCFEKAAAIGESIIMNHPFVDGNKRTGYVLMELILRVEGFRIKATDEELYQFVIDISTGNKRFEEIVIWLKANSESK
ncbi:MAG: type II toxin-antitoxin system death-on-curing family toxin [Chitinophagaceae bacterium]|nr:type II toxin-antitoxin system death-on-curing family toxin [Chitinophagaceae bacterium]